MTEVVTNFKQPRQPKDIPKKSRDAVKARSLGLCEIGLSGVCWGTAAHMHHISRRSQGRDHSPENLKHCCTPCHQQIHTNVAWAKDEGYLA
jgi:5-methylcytosine-specific restriction endonuclease McrA